MNPLKPILTLLFPVICLSASIPDSSTDSYDLTAETYTFILATINSPNEYPVIIEALKTIDDTLNIKLENSHSFINSIYTNTKYVDDAHSWMSEYYESLWPHANVESALNEYERKLTSALKNHARKYTFRTYDNQTEITLEAVNMSGIFLQAKGLSSYLGSSLGISPSDIPGVNEIWTPIYVVDYSTPNDLIIELE